MVLGDDKQLEDPISKQEIMENTWVWKATAKDGGSAAPPLRGLNYDPVNYLTMLLTDIENNKNNAAFTDPTTRIDVPPEALNELARGPLRQGGAIDNRPVPTDDVAEALIRALGSARARAAEAEFEHERNPDRVQALLLEQLRDEDPHLAEYHEQFSLYIGKLEVLTRRGFPTKRFTASTLMTDVHVHEAMVNAGIILETKVDPNRAKMYTDLWELMETCLLQRSYVQNGPESSQYQTVLQSMEQAFLYSAIVGEEMEGKPVHSPLPDVTTINKVMAREVLTILRLVREDRLPPIPPDKKRDFNRYLNDLHRRLRSYERATRHAERVKNGWQRAVDAANELNLGRLSPGMDNGGRFDKRISNVVDGIQQVLLKRGSSFRLQGF